MDMFNYSYPLLANKLKIFRHKHHRENNKKIKRKLKHKLSRLQQFSIKSIQQYMKFSLSAYAVTAQINCFTTRLN